MHAKNSRLCIMTLKEISETEPEMRPIDPTIDLSAWEDPSLNTISLNREHVSVSSATHTRRDYMLSRPQTKHVQTSYRRSRKVECKTFLVPLPEQPVMKFESNFRAIDKKVSQTPKRQPATVNRNLIKIDRYSKMLDKIVKESANTQLAADLSPRNKRSLVWHGRTALSVEEFLGKTRIPLQSPIRSKRSSSIKLKIYGI